VRILVAGATGRYGAIAELLLARGHRVRAGARNLDSPRAERLRERGAELAFADFDAPTSLTVAAGGVDAVFASGTAHRVGPEGEVRHGANLVQALEAAQTPHLVFVSGDGAAADSPVPLFRAKWQVEEAIRASGIPHTILAPTYLMENLFNPWNIELLRAGVFPSPIPVDQPLQQTSVTDLLALAVLAIDHPDDFAGRRIPLASDELTAVQAAERISELIPRELEARRVPLDQLPAPLRFLFGWLESPGHRVEIEALHARLPEVTWHSYAAYAREQRERFRELCPHPEPVAG
jgi:uncharacterized protein YbjT (DUF2867 family)